MFFVCSPNAHADWVSESMAKIVGRNFIASVGFPGADTSSITLEYKIQFGNTGVASLYIFNVGKSGFVVVSGNDVVQPILGFSDRNTFDGKNHSPATGNWLGGYARQIEYAFESNVAPTSAITNEWNELKTSERAFRNKTTGVAPLIATHWDQGKNYNVLCPYDVLQKTNVVTGCVATAMAQIMKYWNWPRSGCGSHQYTDALYGNHYLNFGAVKFEWNKMDTLPYSPDTAVAQLMYCAGVGVDMQYGVGASGAWVIPGDSIPVNTASYALQTFFHYKTTLKAVPRWGNNMMDSFTTAQWLTTLQTELDAHRPVIYVGYNNTSGHCWLCDGYNNSVKNYFHFNWGWGPLSDGYFTLNNLADHLNQYQEAIFGIMPDSFPARNSNLHLLHYLTISNTPTGYGQPFSITAKVANSGSLAFAGRICAEVYDTSGSFVCRFGVADGISIPAGDSTQMLTFNDPGAFNMTAGIYNVHIATMSAGTEDWSPIANDSLYYNYAVLGIANDTDVLICKPLLARDSAIMQGEPITISTGIRNICKARFTGNLDVSLYDVNTGAHIYSIGKQNNNFLNPGALEEVLISNNKLEVPPGNYILAMKHQYKDGSDFYMTGSTWLPNPVMITVVSNPKYNEVTIYPNPAQNSFTLAPLNEEVLSVRILDVTGRVVGQPIPPVLNTKMEFSTSGLTTGMYFIQLQQPHKLITKKLLIVR